MRVVTLNLRSDANRWIARYPLVIDILHALNADVIALQEVRLNIEQHILVRDALNQRLANSVYHCSLCKDWFSPHILANAILSRLPILEEERIELTNGYRTAQRILVEWHGTAINIANTHLHHKPARSENIRLIQMQEVLTWLASQNTACILAGDMNARPHSETIQTAKRAFASTYEAIHQTEPEQTFPTPLRAKEQLRPRTIDYIFYDDQHLRVVDAGLVAAQPHPDDQWLFASDHYGLFADVVTP